MMNIVVNRNARHEYLISEQFEAGIILEGWEIKSIRLKGAQIQDAFVSVRGGEAFLENSHINALLGGSLFESALPLRRRKLLLNSKEIAHLEKKLSQDGFTAVPIDLHFSNGRVKCTLALAKGKKLHDKRQAARESDLNREVAGAMKAVRS